MTWLRGWRPLLRLAGRDALRARGRSVLVLVMIALPVLGVTAADVVIHTAGVSGDEALERRIGAADAVVSFTARATGVVQPADPDGAFWESAGVDAANDRKFDLAEVQQALGRPVRGIERREGSARVSTDKGMADVEGTEIDLRDPLARGLVRMVDGRLPTTRDEVVVNPALVKRGPALGDHLQLDGGRSLLVVGIVDDARYREPARAWSQLGGLDLEDADNGREWFIDGSGPVTWSDVRRLNEVGALVLSRHVVAHPPSNAELAPEVQSTQGSQDSTFAVIALVVVMAVLEVVLLAGPAFAVGARRQSRSLALLAATGGTPRQLRRVVLAGGVVLGSVGAALGVGLGIGIGYAVLPLAQRFDSSYFGPFDVPWLQLLGIAAFGLVSAVLASVVPARIASRQDVVAVLAGRRGDPKPRARSPLFGLVLLGIGIALTVMGASRSSGGELTIAAAAVVAVLGMIFLIPVALAVVARLARRFPLPLRYAVRDAARHRTRTVPAVAAVAATVAGVVALGIGATSDEKENVETYTPMLPMGMGKVANPDLDEFTAGPTEVWSRVVDAVERELPDNAVLTLNGLPETGPTPSSYRNYSFGISTGQALLDDWGGGFGSSVLVADRMPGIDVGVPEGNVEAADAMLGRGGAVVFTSRPVELDKVRITVDSWTEEKGDVQSQPVEVPALFVRVTPGRMQTVQAIVSTPVARRLHVRSAPVGLLIDGPVSRAAEQDVEESLGAITETAWFYVERGYTHDSSTTIALLVLGVLGGVLMLGGTLTATFLALSDARPDLATLAAVGASPRSRRLVAASYAAVVGLVGALLGAAIGFIPGVAVTYPLTGQSWRPESTAGNSPGLPDHYLDVPWLMVGVIVVVLPVVTALVVGLFARSRLPMVSRLN